MELPKIKGGEINGPVYIAPFSCIGIGVYHLLANKGIQVLGFCDDSEALQGKCYLDIPIVTLQAATQAKASATFVIASHDKRMELNQQLLSFGASHILYAGQFLISEEATPAIDAIDNAAAKSLQSEWRFPKAIAHNHLSFYVLTQPQLETNLNVRNVMALMRHLDLERTLAELDAQIEGADYINSVRVAVNPDTTVSQLVQLVQHVNTLKKPISYIRFWSYYTEEQAQQMERLYLAVKDIGADVKWIEGNREEPLIPKNGKPMVALKIGAPFSAMEDFHKCLFVHVPKTAGISFASHLSTQAGLYPDATYHKFARDCKKSDPDQFDSYYKFALVRNPWDWLVSYYFYIQNVLQKFGFNPSQGTIPHILAAPTFRDAVLRLRNNTSQWDWGAIPQHKWVCDERGNILVDYVGRFEDLSGSFRYIGEKLGLDSAALLPHENATKHRSYTEYYDEEMIEIVRQVYQKDIEIFGYDFDKSPKEGIIVNARNDYAPGR